MTTIQVRDVPDAVSRELKARAAAEGQSLSQYVLTELVRVVERPARRQVLDRIEARGRIELPAAADVLADECDERP